MKLSELQAAAVGSRHLVVPHVALDDHQLHNASAQYPSLALSAYIGTSERMSSSSSLTSPTPTKRSRADDSNSADAADADADASASAGAGVGGLSAALADLSAILENVRVARVGARERANDTPALLVPLRRALLEQKLAALAIIRVHFGFLYSERIFTLSIDI